MTNVRTARRILFSLSAQRLAPTASVGVPAVHPGIGALTSQELAALSTCTHALCSLLGSELRGEGVFGAVSLDAFLNVESIQKISFSKE